MGVLISSIAVEWVEVTLAEDQPRHPTLVSTASVVPPPTQIASTTERQEFAAISIAATDIVGVLSRLAPTGPIPRFSLMMVVVREIPVTMYLPRKQVS
jgi:hypothetical protein